MDLDLFSSTPAFVYPDLRTWTPPPGGVPVHAQGGAFAAALRQQGVDLTDAAERRDLIVRLAVGGLGERPFGDHDQNASFRQRKHHDEAQARSRLLSVLFDAEKEDRQAPLVDATTAAVVHLVALTYYGDVNWEDHSHSDFTRFLTACHEQFEQPRIDKIGQIGHFGGIYDAGQDFLTSKAASDPEAREIVSYLAAKIVRRAHRPGDAMHRAGPTGERRLWGWMDLIMTGEPAPSPAEPMVANRGRAALRFLLGSRGYTWTDMLDHLDPQPELDARAPALLRRFLAGVSRSETVIEALGRHAQRIEGSLTAQARTARAENVDVVSGPRHRRRRT